MTTRLSLQIKQVGGTAYVRCFNRSVYDVLMDDELFGDLADLWDCATLEALQALVAQTGSIHPAQAYLQAVCAQIGGQDSRLKASRQPQPVP